MMREVSSVLVGAALCLAMLLGSSTAWAADDEKAAKAAFENAKALYGKEKFSEAAEAFRRAYSAKPSWKLLYNIGQSEAAAKRYGLALEAFEKYLAEGGDDVKVKRQKEVREEIQRLRDMVGSLDVRTPDGAVITVDDVERGTAPLTGHVIVAAGVDHHVAVVLDGETIIERDIRVTGGQIMVVEVEPEAEPKLPSEMEDEGEAAGDESTPMGQPGSSLRTAGWITLGVGAAAMIGGAVTGGMALSTNKDLEAACDGPSCPANVDSDKEKKRDTLALATDILIPAGAVIAAAGIVLLIVDAARGKERDDGTDQALRVMPVFATDGAGLSIERSF